MFAVLRQRLKYVGAMTATRQHPLPDSAVRRTPRQCRPDRDVRLLPSTVCYVFDRTVKPDRDRTSPRWPVVTVDRADQHVVSPGSLQGHFASAPLSPREVDRGQHGRDDEQSEGSDERCREAEQGEETAGGHDAQGVRRSQQCEHLRPTFLRGETVEGEQIEGVEHRQEPADDESTGKSQRNVSIDEEQGESEGGDGEERGDLPAPGHAVADTHPHPAEDRTDAHRQREEERPGWAEPERQGEGHCSHLDSGDRGSGRAGGEQPDPDRTRHRSSTPRTRCRRRCRP